MKSLIIVDTKEKSSILKLFKNTENKYVEELSTDVFIGKNGSTFSKQEGDGKTPLGTFNLGVVLGEYDRKNIVLDDSIEYVKINEHLYWIDDVNSKHYNRLVDITKTNKDWESAEHLVNYPVQYEYAIEIKTNPDNIPGRGSAIFIHCSTNTGTAGCVALPKEAMVELLAKIDKDTKIIIK